MDYRFFGLEKHQDRGMVRWCRSQVGKWVERIAAAGGFSKPLAQLAISLFEEPDLRQYLKEIRVRIQRPRRPEFSRFSDMDDVATQLENGLRSGRFGGDGVAVIREIVETSLLFMGPEPEPGDPDQIRGTLEELRDLFRLTAAEAEILLFFVVVDLHEPLRDYLGNRALPVLARTLSAAIPCELADAHRILHEDGRLRMLGLLGIREPRFAPFFEPGPGILDHLLGFSGTRFLDRLCKKDDGPVLPMDCFSLTLDERAILDGLVRSGQPFHLLIHGRAGTGKTELARTLVRQSGRGAWFVRQGKKGDREERKLGVEAALAVSAEDRGIVVVDESESLISSPFGPFMGNTGEGKAWVNDFLDRRAGRMIWIVNDLDWVPESTRRRFTYSLPFRRFTRGQRANAWTQLAAGHPQEQALSPELLRDLTERYEVNAAGI
ncbi:MAG: ATP-binding protein, partial [Deltaproteobacteria bacterium]|nr:ATP-binding protein [Deltaproteobacteria bacterium]